MNPSPFERCRESFALLDVFIQDLKSELVRKDAVIVRLKSEQNSTILSSFEYSTQGNRMNRGIFCQSDLQNFLNSPTCEALCQFLLDLNSCAKGNRFESEGSNGRDLDIDKALNKSLELIDQTPLEDVDPQRFGNKAYRKWHAKLCKEYLDEINPEQDEFGSYFTRSFGDPTRLDFGTGHEVAFLMLLFVIYNTQKNTGNLRHFLNVTIPRYLQVVRRLRLVYRLEPAGSHGVWSLDDYHFLPFILGSSQLSEGHTHPKDLLENPSFSELTTDSDFFSDALLDILRSKKGPFREHSPLLHSLRNCTSWEEVNSGLIKMWRGEVLSKFPVAQHFLFRSQLTNYLASSRVGSK